MLGGGEASSAEGEGADVFLVVPQQLGELRGLADKASGWFGAAAENLAPGSARFRSEGSTHKTLGSARFRSEGSIHKRLGSARFHTKIPFIKRPVPRGST